MIVYVDSLILLNFYIDYLLLLATEKLCKLHTGFWHRVLAALFSSFCSLLIFLPELNVFINFSLKLAVACVTLIIGYKFIKKFEFIVSVVCFLASTYLFCGASLFLYSLLQPSNMSINNSVVYYSISPLVLIGSTTLCYVLICVYRRIFVRKGEIQNKATAEIKYNNKCVCVSALIDSGNMLTDIYSDMPVTVIDDIAFSHLTGFNKSDFMPDYLQKAEMLNGFRLIPVSTVSADTFLVGFKADAIKISFNGVGYDIKSPILAVSSTKISGCYSAIISENLLCYKGVLQCLST